MTLKIVSMKKIILTLLVAIIAIVADATNYQVTVTTQRVVEFRDKQGNVVGGTTETGNVMTFYVSADSPYAAEQEAISRCQGACNSGIFRLEARNVRYSNQNCDKYVQVVPYNAKAEVNK